MTKQQKKSLGTCIAYIGAILAISTAIFAAGGKSDDISDNAQDIKEIKCEINTFKVEWYRTNKEIFNHLYEISGKIDYYNTEKSHNVRGK